MSLGFLASAVQEGTHIYEREPVVGGERYTHRVTHGIHRARQPPTGALKEATGQSMRTWKQSQYGTQAKGGTEALQTKWADGSYNAERSLPNKVFCSLV